jgi:hypothetical protein
VPVSDDLVARIEAKNAELAELVAEAEAAQAEAEATLTDAEYLAASVVKFLDKVAASPNKEKFESAFRAGNVGMAIFAKTGHVIESADAPADGNANDFRPGTYL